MRNCRVRKTIENKKYRKGKELKKDRRMDGRERGKDRIEIEMKITHLEQSLLNYPPHILSPLGYVRVELVQIRGER